MKRHEKVHLWPSWWAWLLIDDVETCQGFMLLSLVVRLYG